MHRTPGSWLPLCLAISCAGAGLTVMLSGYASGGQLGLPPAAALCGVALAGVLLGGTFEPGGLVGVSTVLVFSLLVIGHFFGELRSVPACLLLAAPLAGWLPELPLLAAVPRLLKNALRVLLVGAIVGLVVLGAGRKFAADTQTPAEQPGSEDYLNFGS